MRIHCELAQKSVGFSYPILPLGGRCPKGGGVSPSRGDAPSRPKAPVTPLRRLRRQLLLRNACGSPFKGEDKSAFSL
jgi:hypothetical protein